MEKVILITGTSRGIGLYLAERLLADGHRVIGCSRSAAALVHDRYQHYQTDISDEKAVVELVRSIRKDAGRIDVLINNAAINPAIAPAALVSQSAIEKSFRVNVFAVMYFCREVIKLMQRQKWGRIINFSSMAAKLEVPGETVYTATKAALNAYSRVLAKEVYRMGITVNVVAPSAIPTELSAQINQEALMEVLSRNAIPHYGEMADVYETVQFLIQEKSKAITGQIVYLGGV